jgi:ribose-phosphate pyrophosphokinase
MESIAALPPLQPRVYAPSETRELAALTCREAGLGLGSLEECQFEGGEFKLRPLESVRNRIAYVFQTLAGSATTPVSDRLVRLLFLLSVLRDAGASERIAVIPYLAYARQERRAQLRDPVNTRYVAQLLEAAGADRVITLDVHDPAALDNAFRIPTDHLSALPMMANHFATRFGTENLVVISPDVGGIKRAQVFQELLESQIGREVELAFIEKRRASGAVSTGRVVGDIEGRRALIIDDLCATGGTCVRAADRCREAGAVGVHVAVTHVPCAAGLGALAASQAITDIVATDSVSASLHSTPLLERKLTTLSVAQLFGHALQRLQSGEPLGPLLSRWPVSTE